MGACVRISELEKSRKIAETYKGAERIYYIYAGRVLIKGTDHQRTAHVLVKQREALGEVLTVYCAKPQQRSCRCVYQTSSQGGV